MANLDDIGIGVVRFRDAKEDFAGVAEMVDETGAVVILRHGRPAYVLADYDDVTVNEEGSDDDECCGGAHKGECCGGDKPGANDRYSNNGKCRCGADKGECGCGGHGGHRHGGPGHRHGGPGHGHGGPGHGPGERCACGEKETCDCGREERRGRPSGGPGRPERVGGPAEGGPRPPRPGHPRGPRPEWQRPNERHADRRRREWEDDPRSKNYEWAERKIREFERAARHRLEEQGVNLDGAPGIPGFLPTEVIGIVPDEVIEAGEQIVNKLASIFGAFAPPEDRK